MVIWGLYHITEGMKKELVENYGKDYGMPLKSLRQVGLPNGRG